MLTPEYLADCAMDALTLYDQLETEIAKEIARQIATTGTITDAAAWQIERYQSSGGILEYVVQETANQSGQTADTIRKIFEDAAKEGIYNDKIALVDAGLLETKGAFELSPEMLQSLEATITKTQGNLRNLTLTTGSTAQNLYLEQTNLAYMKVQSGAYSYQQAIAEAVKAAAKEGAWVIYGQRANGSVIRSRLDVAVRRSIMTGVNQTCGKITEMLTEDESLGIEYYEVSAHLGARPSHQDWQGQVYQINGSSREYKNFYDETGYGTGDGLCGYNCRHSFYPYWPGISKRAYSKSKLDEYANRSYEYAGQVLTEYQCSQIQRSYEREIRESQRTIAAYKAAMDATGDESVKSALKESMNEESGNLSSTYAEMKSFCKATKRRVDEARL